MPQTQNLSLAAINAGMVSEAAFAAEAKRLLQFGNIVRRAAANLPQTAAAPIFTVTGDVAIIQVYGKVGTVIQTQADSIKLIFNPTVGTDVDLCAALNISAKAANTMFGITGIVADALIGAGLAVRGMQVPLFLQTGTIDLDATASNTGTIAWTLMWVPLSDGATVVAA